MNNRYDVKRFDGTKSVVLSTAGPLGGKNEFLAIAFILVGIICLIIGLIFFMKMKLSKGEFGGYGNNKNKWDQQIIKNYHRIKFYLITHLAFET